MKLKQNKISRESGKSVRAKTKGLNLGDLIKKHRVKKNLSQGDLAERLGFANPMFVSLIERGKSKVPLKVLGQLIIHLEIPEEKVQKLLLESYLNDVSKGLSIGKSLVKKRAS